MPRKTRLGADVSSVFDGASMRPRPDAAENSAQFEDVMSEFSQLQ